MTTEKVEKFSSQEVSEKIKVYSIRWFILGIFVAYSAANGFHWIQYSIISDVVTKYYDISSTLVDWTSMLYMVLYIVFIFPATYIMEKGGLRKTVLLGMTLTCWGSWIKVVAVQNSFWIAFIGQFVVAFGNIFVLSVPSRLAAVWFGPSEVGLSCSFGVFGNQLGVALGFLIPPMVVDNQSTPAEQQQQFYILLGATAGFSTVILILVIIFFKDAPPTPPFHAALQQEMIGSNADFGQCLKRLVLNKSYMIVLVTYGINAGVYFAMSTFLNQIIIYHYGNKAAVDAGWIGLLITVTGMVGSIICGYILDRWRRYKETTLIFYALSLICMVTFSFTLSKGLYVVYATSSVLGFFMTGLLPVGFELGVELTYPEPEGTSAALLNLSTLVFGMAFTLFYSFLITKVGDLWVNVAMCIMLGIGTISLTFVSSERKRQSAQSP